MSTFWQHCHIFSGSPNVRGARGVDCAYCSLVSRYVPTVTPLYAFPPFHADNRAVTKLNRYSYWSPRHSRTPAHSTTHRSCGNQPINVKSWLSSKNSTKSLYGNLSQCLLFVNFTAKTPFHYCFQCVSYFCRFIQTRLWLLNRHGENRLFEWRIDSDYLPNDVLRQSFFDHKNLT